MELLWPSLASIAIAGIAAVTYLRSLRIARDDRYDAVAKRLAELERDVGRCISELERR